MVLVLLAWAVTLRPTQLGGPATYVVVSGDSMEPTLSDGDLVVLRHQDGYGVGDVVSYPVPAGGPGAGSLVIHRVVAGDGDGLTTQGDNRDRPDDWRPTAADLRGTLWWHVPGGGLLLLRLLQPPVIAALAGGLSTTWILMRRPAAGQPSAWPAGNRVPSGSAGEHPARAVVAGERTGGRPPPARR
ncbi:S26 family signal peptidase [Ornithinimicrobium avium]|uniref:S26 family signal peptidase n=1 Tax=Ornithinimicrobium avium TaxID=2283195 RepID=UPI0013B439D1|nr:S26 family signal peptidase [Ornithinimicrobium avium]